MSITCVISDGDTNQVGSRLPNRLGDNGNIDFEFIVSTPPMRRAFDAAAEEFVAKVNANRGTPLERKAAEDGVYGLSITGRRSQ